MTENRKYQKTLVACYLGFVTQAISANFAPLLFLTFQNIYGISLEKIALIPVVFYLTQLLIDLGATKFADKIGYRICSPFLFWGFSLLWYFTPLAVVLRKYW